MQKALPPGNTISPKNMNALPSTLISVLVILLLSQFGWILPVKLRHYFTAECCEI